MSVIVLNGVWGAFPAYAFFVLRAVVSGFHCIGIGAVIVRTCPSQLMIVTVTGDIYRTTSLTRYLFQPLL